MKKELLPTSDGSHTIYLPELDETYHSRHGAITESDYVYIRNGLEAVSTAGESLDVLEFGFGTGLNALLTLLWAKEHGKKIRYLSVEKYPLTEDTWTKLNYGEELKAPADFEQLHKASWNQWQELHPSFALFKYDGDFLRFKSERDVDVLFYDAFAPSRQADVWTKEYLEKAAESLKTGGVFITYCAQGEFRRNLKETGFEMQSLQGPPGKKEITRGVLKIEGRREKEDGRTER